MYLDEHAGRKFFQRARQSGSHHGMGLIREVDPDIISFRRQTDYISRIDFFQQGGQKPS